MKAPTMSPVSTNPGLTVAMVARRLGLAPATLRTWDRRYGIGPSEHAEGAHRRYSETDVARLMEMRRLILAGNPVAVAAAAVSTGTSPRPIATATSGSCEDVAIAIRGITNAAMSLDHYSLLSMLEREFRSRGARDFWTDVVTPVLVEVGERWQTTQSGIEVEHTLSEALLELLTVAARSVSNPVNATPILLASADEELHSLPLHALAAALAQHQIAARVFGARTPPSALAAAVRRTGPAAVFIWSHLPTTGGVEQLQQMPTLRPSPTVIAGGPGWDRASLPKTVRFAGSLDEAISAIRDSLGLL